MNIIQKKMIITPAARLDKLPKYLFAHLEELRDEKKRQGVDIIDLGIGDPDLATPTIIVEKLAQAASEPANQRYPTHQGLRSFREAVADWYTQRFGVTLDAEKEVLILIGSKEGIAHLPLALLNPEEVALIPSPGYPPYYGSTVLAGGIPHLLPLLPQNQFLPDLTGLSPQLLTKTKLLFLNYPNNPTGAVADGDFFADVVNWAAKHNIIVCHDAAYTEINYDGYLPNSFLEVPGAKEVGIEFHSLSKTFNMTGWRVGFVVGNQQVLQALGKVKSHIDSGVFQAIQYAGMTALTHHQELTTTNREIYQRRRDVLWQGLQEVGWVLPKPKATFYFWLPLPAGYSSAEFSSHLLEQAEIVAVPGVGFGEAGEGFVRLAITVTETRLAEAVSRMKQLTLFSHKI